MPEKSGIRSMAFSGVLFPRSAIACPMATAVFDSRKSSVAKFQTVSFRAVPHVYVIIRQVRVRYQY